MKSKQYHDLIRRLEREVEAQPRRYRSRVRRLALVGYAYVVLILAVMLGLLGFLTYWAWTSEPWQIWILVGIVAISTFQVLSSLFSANEGPPGIRLRRKEHPNLYDDLDQLRKDLKLPRIRSVMLTEDFNAGAAQYRTFGWFGVRKTVLSLGVPILEAMSAEEMRSILAHELAHISKGHSRLAGNIFHLRLVWMNLLQRMDGLLGQLILGPFARWYGPYFEAYTIVMMREHEYEADRLALNATNGPMTVVSQIRTEILSRTAVPDYFEELRKLVIERSNPIKDSVSRQIEKVQLPFEEERSRKVLRRALAEETSIHETHPSLMDRIVPAGFPQEGGLDDRVEAAWRLANAVRGDAAGQYYLGERRERLIKELDQTWFNQAQVGWTMQHRYAEQQREFLTEAEERIQKSEEEALVDELFGCAGMVADLEGEGAAVEKWEAILEREPDHAASLFSLGRYAVGEEYELEKGKQLILRAMELDASWETAGCEILEVVAREQENAEEAKKWAEQGFGARDTLELAQEERVTVTTKDTLIEPDLPEERREALMAQFAEDLRVRAVWVARKKVDHLTEVPFYLIGVVPETKWWKLRSESENQKLADDLLGELRFGEQYLLVVLHGNGKSFASKFKKLGKDKGMIYERTG